MAETPTTAYAFPTEDAYDRVQDAVRAIEHLVGTDRSEIHHVPHRPGSVWVKIDGAVDAGYYPGKLVYENPDGTLLVGDEVWVKCANASEVLSYSVVYEGSVVTDREVSGVTKAVVKVLGELEAEFVVADTWKIDDTVTPCQIVPLTFKKVKLRAVRLTLTVEPYTP